MTLSDFSCANGHVAVTPLAPPKAKGGLDFGAVGSSSLVPFSVVIGNRGSRGPGHLPLMPGDIVYLSPNDADALKLTSLRSFQEEQGNQDYRQQFMLADVSRIQVLLHGWKLKTDSAEVCGPRDLG